MSDPDPRVLEGALHPAENVVLFGHEHAESFLARNYATGKGHHAILIEGPEGIGKASLAFRFAQHVLTYPDPATAPDSLSSPDPNSTIHHQIVAGASHNLVHLVRPVDEKSGRLKSAITVEEVRKVGKFFGQTSGNDNWRIVIIDTADDLNRSAANAILKMLEEPPRRAMFLVLSHHPGRLLPTIRSRCMPLVLHPLERTAMQAALGHLGFNVAGEAGERLVGASDGSVSMAIKLINYGGMEIVDAFQAVVKARGAGQRREMHRLADALTGRDKDTAFEFFADHVSEYLREQAREKALAGDIAKADRVSRLYSSVSERLSIAEGYNLDKKQTILGLLGDIAALG